MEYIKYDEKKFPPKNEAVLVCLCVCLCEKRELCMCVCVWQTCANWEKY